METTIYNLLNANKKLALAYYKVLKKTKGLWCKIKTPVSKGSIFGREDIVEYDEFVERKDQLLLFGIFTETSLGGNEYDTFIEGAYALTLYNERLPLQTELIVNFCGRKMSFKVDDHKNLFPTTCEQLFIKNMLVSAT